MKTTLSIFGFLLIVFFANEVSAQKAKTESLYTSLDSKNCRTLEQSTEEAGSYRGECAGVGGYKLQVTEGDLRQSVDVVAPNKKRFELDLTVNVSSAFSSVGDKAEWRVVRAGKKVVPLALIVRFNASENPEDSSKTTSYLVVAKITKARICVTDVVKPGANANDEARKLADSSSAKSCKIASN